MRGFIITSLLLSLGCRNDKGAGSVSDDVGIIYAEADAPELVMTLASESTQAGNSVDFTLALHHDDGDIIPVEGVLSSDIEVELYSTYTTIHPTLAGTHVLSASHVWDETGEVLTAEGELIVDAGELAWLDLALSDLAMQAGSSVDYWLTGGDTWDNPIDVSGATLSLSSEDLNSDATTFSGTVPGIYEIVAAVDEVQDTELLVVTPGDAVSVDLTLSTMDVELFETISAYIAIMDDYGNLTNDPWTLSVDGEGATSLSYNNITFWEEGEYWVRVDVDDTALYDEEGPIMVDSTGPVITIEEPERGAWVEGDPSALSGTVSGTVVDDWSGITDLDVNGTSVAVSADGSFSTVEDYEFGTNVIETSAIDGDDNISIDTRAVLAGSFIEYAEYAGSGIVARLHEGAGGLDALAALGEGLIDSSTLADLIPSPVFSDSEEDCVDLGWFGTYCVTWYSVNLYITNPTISGTTLDLDPKGSGYLEATFSVGNPSLDWSASGTVVGISYSGSGDVTADDISIWMELNLYVDNNVIYAEVNDLDVSSTNFSFDVDSWLYDVLNFFGVDFDGLVQGYMEDALEDAILDEVPALVEDLFQDLELSTQFDVMDEPLTMSALPEKIDVDESGLTVHLETSVTVDEWRNERVGEGSLHYGYTPPTWTGSPGMILGLNADLVNQLFYAMWGAGVLEMTLTEDDLGISTEDLSLLFPDMTGLTITTEPLLPLVVIPDPAEVDVYELQFGDMLVTLWNGEVTEGNELLQVYVTGFGGFDLDMGSGGDLVPTLSDMDLYFDVVVPQANTVGAADTEAVFQILMPVLLDDMIGGIASLPIPEIDGFSMSGMTVGIGGAESGFVTVEGNISE